MTVDTSTWTEVADEAALRELLGDAAAGAAQGAHRAARAGPAVARRLAVLPDRHGRRRRHLRRLAEGRPGRLRARARRHHDRHPGAPRQPAGRRLPQHPGQPARRADLPGPRPRRHAADQRPGPAGPRRAVLRRHGRQGAPPAARAGGRDRADLLPLRARRSCGRSCGTRRRGTTDGLPRRAVIARTLERPQTTLEELDAYYGPAYAERLYRQTLTHSPPLPDGHDPLS